MNNYAETAKQYTEETLKQLKEADAEIAEAKAADPTGENMFNDPANFAHMED